MKITMDVDCTPEEARRFFGLPDVAPMQEAVMAEVQKRALTSLQAMEPEALLKTWMPVGIQGWEQMQKLFWNAMGAGAAPGAKKGSE
jgi:hypothetical protein